MDQALVNYENRIRQLSQPDKVFKYFSSVTRETRSYMTAEDFIRSLIPSTTINKKVKVTSDSIIAKLADLDDDGLISFQEYMFITRLLASTDWALWIRFLTSP